MHVCACACAYVCVCACACACVCVATKLSIEMQCVLYLTVLYGDDRTTINDYQIQTPLYIAFYLR